MSAGDLSADQARFVDLVAASSGLERLVVVAWVGAESGWNLTKAGHNYLNVGPGERYSSAEQAAGRVITLLRNSRNYAGIRAAIPAGPPAQVRAIVASPWGTSATIVRVYEQLSGQAVAGAATSDDEGLLGRIPTPAELLDAIPTPGDAAGAAADAVTSSIERLAGPLVEMLGKQVLTLVLGLAGAGLVALGLNRITQRPVGDAVDKAKEVAGLVGLVHPAGRAAAAAAG